MYKDLKAIYDRNRKDLFVMAVSHLMTIGFKSATEITDNMIEGIEEQRWATKEFIQELMRVTRDIATVIGNGSPVELIQFCEVEDIFDTTFYGDKRKIAYDRMCEIATKALNYIEDHEEFEDFDADWDVDLDGAEREFLGLETEEEDYD